MAPLCNHQLTLDLYIRDYLEKKNLKGVAKIFMEETNVSGQPVGIEDPKGFLLEWFSIFYKVYESQMHGSGASNPSGKLASLPAVMPSSSLRPPHEFSVVEELNQKPQLGFNQPQNPLASQFRLNEQLLGELHDPQMASFISQMPPQQQCLHENIQMTQFHQQMAPELHMGYGHASPNHSPLMYQCDTNGKGLSLSPEIGRHCQVPAQKSLPAARGRKSRFVRAYYPEELQRTALEVGSPDPGFSLTELLCLPSSTSQLVCCDFSPDGGLLASAGHDKKVIVWNIGKFHSRSSLEEHSSVITDIRCRPNSCLFATSSFDKTLKVWDSTDLTSSQCQLVGHLEPAMSLDFHPKRVDLLSSCDCSGEIRLWNVDQRECKRASKGGSANVRFQPQDGWLLAAAAGSLINLIDVETDQIKLSLQGHIKAVSSICWEVDGRYIATVSQDSARIWSVQTGECIRELISTPKKFHTCIFHPVYSSFLLVGSDQSIDVWCPQEAKVVSYPAHERLVAGLASSSTGLVASASHDGFVKLWK